MARPPTAIALFVGASLLAAGCVGPLVSDELDSTYSAVYSKHTPFEEIPEVEDDPILEAQVLAYQGFEGNVIRRVSGFADGAPVEFWDFGEAPAFAIPIYLLAEDVAEDGSAFTAIDHPTIIDSIPGDPGYSPFWQVFVAPVTEAYDGEVITSFAAVQEARDLGLLGEPVVLDAYVNCPVVHRGTKLEVDGGFANPIQFYYRGLRASYYAFGLHPLAGSNAIWADTVYELRREGGEPLDEVHRGVDMTGDGDTTDTNHVFGARLEDEDYSPLVTTTEVVVAPGTASIDTNQDDATSDVMGTDDLFAHDGSPITPLVVALYPDATTRNLPEVMPLEADY